MSAGSDTPERNEWVNFVPFVTLASAIFVLEGLGFDIAGRILLGIHIIAFYSISVRMVFTKHFSKLVILLILFPATAIPTYLIMLFLRPLTPEPEASVRD